jgi:hypothetical protein
MHVVTHALAAHRPLARGIVGALVGAAALVAGCERVPESPPLVREPRLSGVGSAAATATAPLVASNQALDPPGSPGLGASGPSAAPTASAAPASSGDTTAPTAPAVDDAALAEPALLDAMGKPLPQMEGRPSTDSPAFQRRAQLLWDAIVAGDASIAERAFFPVVAYAQVKDIRDPAADWRSRLMRHFARDVLDYHRKLGDDPKACRFDGVEIDEGRVQWMKPGREGNRLGYYRITRGRIRYLDPKGKPRRLELTSLISWRGEWFVVHLHGFR